MSLWKPSASMDTLRARAKILANIRQFFLERDVLEVETPALSHAAVTDVQLSCFESTFVGPEYSNGATLYLQTSPEFHMKRLLANGSGSIFQLSKAFRNEECGRHHNPEFTMLEWYRVGFDDKALMAEMDEFMQRIALSPPAKYISYNQLFLKHFNFCALTASIAEIKAVCAQLGYGNISDSETDREVLLQLLFTLEIEPKFDKNRPLFVHNFPAPQAALAKLDPDNPGTAKRFELYYQGMELANGFDELTDAKEQARRFEADNQKRQKLGLPTMVIDNHFLAALAAGLPNCAGVAMGIDRLIMICLQKKHIQDVIGFEFYRS